MSSEEVRELQDAATPRESREPSVEGATDGDFCPSVASVASSAEQEEEIAVKRTRSNSIEAEESENCLICFEPWTNSGSHRIVSLRCGHLFGKSCVEKWARNNPRCPQCQREIRRHDIRVLYSRSIKVLDTAELEQARRQLNSERFERKRLEIELAECRLHCQLLEMDVKRLERENFLLRQNSNEDSELKRADVTGKSNRSLLSKLEYCHPINMDAGGRVITYSELEGLLLYSQQSLTPLFRGFGVVKVNIADPRLSEFLPLHKKQIRDLSVNPKNGILLTCGIDSSAKLVDLRTNAVSQSYDLKSAVWSCTWNKESNHYFYAGLSTGTVQIYDTRMTEGVVEEINTTSTAVCPVVALEHVRGASSSDVGLFVGHLLRASLYSFDDQLMEHRYHALPAKGSVMSANFENETRHLVVSVRPTAAHRYVQHDVYCVNKSREVELVNTVKGSKTAAILTRAKLVRHPSSNSLYVCAFDEQQSALTLCDVSDSSAVCILPHLKRIADICPVTSGDEKSVALLSTISPDAFRIYKIHAN